MKLQTPRSSKISRPLLGMVAAVMIVQPILQAASAEAQKKRRHDHSDSVSWPLLDGFGNNESRPLTGTSNTPYTRIAPAVYADGIGQMVTGPELRYISNRIFADGAQNLFSQNGVTQWAYNWGQFIDHTIGLREEGTEVVEIAFDASDPLEHFSNSALNLQLTRSAAVIANGGNTYREQVNTVSSFIDGWAVYGGTAERLEWLREGPVDGDFSNNNARLILTDSGNLPTLNIRGDASSAPAMERQGRLMAIPQAEAEIIVAGDVRANENIALTAVQTLFAREHNRIVDALPARLSEQKKFDIARQIVIAIQQYITYNEFLPAVGVTLSEPTRYMPDVDPSVTNEFATVGYRAHSMIHGEIEMEVPVDKYGEDQLDAFRAQGIEVEAIGNNLELAVPLNVAFGNPQLTAALGVDALSIGLGLEPQYKNDEQIDNQLRSVLFQLPNPDVLDPDSCLDGVTLNTCFSLVSDLGVMDVFRARDHGIPDYNSLRVAYGLRPVDSFIDITGEDSEEFPVGDPLVDSNDPINDPDIMEFIELQDAGGNPLELGSEAADGEAVIGVRRTTLASRLKAIYGSVDQVDAFVGMVSEAHLPGSEFGALQHEMWKRQFEAVRDGDSNFYLWSKSLRRAMKHAARAGITYRQRLSDIIINNTELTSKEVRDNMFLTDENF